MKTDLECIYNYAKTQPEKLAVIHEYDTIDYNTLWHKIVSFGRFLLNNEFKKDNEVFLKAKRASSHIVAYYGIQFAGGVPVILSEGMNTDAILEMARQYGIRWIIMDGGGDSADIDGLHIISHDNVILSAIEEQSIDVQSFFPSLDNISEVLFSSGTTGKAKGVLVTHKNIISVAESCIREMGLQEDHVSMITIPIESVGPMRELHFTMQRGSTLVIAGSMLNINSYFGLIEVHHVTGLYLTPYAFSVLFQIASDKLKQYQDQIRLVSSAASPLPETTREKLIEVLPHSRLFHFYSTTEFGLVSIMEYSAMRDKKDCSGFLRDTMRVRIVDDNMQDVPVGEKGSILVKGDSVSPGYFKAPDLTKAAFTNDGWMLSGDVGFLDKDGYLYIVGRRDDIIIVSGYKVAPSMIEDVAMLCGLLKECVCIAYYDPKTKMEGLKMLIVPNEGKGEIAKKTLVKEMKKRLNEVLAENNALIKAALARILAVEIIDNVPRGKNGKIDRKLLRQPQ